MNITLLSMVATLLSGAVAIFFLWKSKEASKTNKRVSEWFDTEEGGRRSFLYIIGDRYDQSELSENLRSKILKANINIKASEYMAICIAVFAGLWAFSNFVLQLLFPLDLAFSYAIVWIGSKVILKSLSNKRSTELNRQLPEICRMMSKTMKAGLTLTQGFDKIAEEISGPAGEEFEIVSYELSLGDNMEAVLNRLIERVDSEELKIFVHTVLIQRIVGGNLPEVLSHMAGTLEERERVHKEIKTLTAESKQVSYLLPAMPVVMVIMMNLVMPGFLNPLFTPFGLVLLAIVIVLQVLAFVIISKMSKVRV